MLRHIVMWDFKEGLTEEQKSGFAKRMKKDLEALPATIKGLKSLEVIISVLPTSNREVVLNSLFTSEEDLANYQVHPDHVRVSQYASDFLANRGCADYYEQN